MKKTILIKDSRGEAYVPRPSSWGGGLARSVWIKERWGYHTHIASPELWRTLSARYVTYELSEDEDGELVMRTIHREE